MEVYLIHLQISGYRQRLRHQQAIAVFAGRVAAAPFAKGGPGRPPIPDDD